MEDSNFFKWIWRFNGIMISLAGVAVILATFVGVIIVAFELTQDRTVHNVVHVEEQIESDDSEKIEESWKFGHMSVISDSHYAVVPLNSVQGRNSASYSKSLSSTRNYLFMDTTSNRKQWLLPHNDYLLLNRESLSHSAALDTPVAVTVSALMYEVIKQDSNKDEQLSRADMQTIALSNIDGSNYTEVLSNIDIVLGSTVTADNQLFIVYQRQNVGYSATIDLTHFKVKNESELPQAGIKN
ncbi:hypothetical protein [Corallincola spongiicola]|uniref:Uncharacterized protein n=1 Tax=Corallincola spongiicola TaxID=2520508 RepID=A0ABY1WTH4_9GAMM|nr:hypothetical protein [Corallincola spongiicola]TAA47827.1 hypothetical protein EXY25_00830 [Corallincola spongiicola]